jgi:predicted DNA-binding WGR domain protein
MAFLTRTDLTRNIDRFYVVDITPTLFGEWAAVLREWGRRGSPGTLRLDSYRRARGGAVSRAAHDQAPAASWLREERQLTDRLSLTNALADANIDRQKAERIATEIFDAIHDVATRPICWRWSSEYCCASPKPTPGSIASSCGSAA